MKRKKGTVDILLNINSTLESMDSKINLTDEPSAQTTSENGVSPHGGHNDYASLSVYRRMSRRTCKRITFHV
jgi:hypothetical protein